MEEFWSPVFVSGKVAAAAVIWTAVIGTMAGKAMAGRAFKGKIAVETLLMIPLVLPPTVVGLILIVLFGNKGMFGKVFEFPLMFTWQAAVIAAVVVAFPLMFQTAKQAFLSVDRDIVNAAKVDGANGWNILWRVELPLAARQLVSGVILSFTRGFGEFGATLMFAGNIPGETQTIPVAIYVAYEAGNMELVWLWVSVSVTFSFLLLWIASRLK
jgi:molybdate transport system permease protein